MPRNLSATARASVHAQNTSEVWLQLLEIYEDSLPEPIRVVNDVANVTSSVSGSSELYLASGFGAELPAETEGETVAVANLRIENIDGRMAEAVQLALSAPEATLWIVLASDPDTAEAGPFVFDLAEVDWDALSVTGQLRHEPALDRAYPKDRHTSWTFPDA